MSDATRNELLEIYNNLDDARQQEALAALEALLVADGKQKIAS